MWTPVKKCGVVALREIFVLILCVASVSFLVTYQIGQSIVYTGTDDVSKDGLSHGHGSSETIRSGKMVGRSLNMHAASNEKVEPRPASLLSRLLQLEENLLEHTRRRRIGVIGLKEQAGDASGSSHRSFTSSGQTVFHVKEEDIVLDSSSAIIQGNYSMVLCGGEPSTCPKSIRSPSGEIQRGNRIITIEKELCNPRRLCEVASFIHRYKEKNERHLNHPCNVMSKDRTEVKDTVNKHYPLIITTSRNHSNMIEYNTTLSSVLQRYQGSDIESLWIFPSRPLTFQTGSLLELELLVASFRPLRLYMYPSVVTGPVDALSEPHLFGERTTMEEILQYVGEKYGLTASKQWWNSIQSILVKNLVSVEIASQKHYTPWKRCVRCFGVYKVDVICVNIRQCHIIKMAPLLSEVINSRVGLLEPLLHLMTSERMVAMDVANALEEGRRLTDYQLCEGEMTSEVCLTEAILIYLLDDRRETLTNTDLVKIYPTPSSSMFTPFLSDVGIIPLAKEGHITADVHYLLMSLEKYYTELAESLPENIDVSDDLDLYGTRVNTDYPEHLDQFQGEIQPDKCSQDSEFYKELTKLDIKPMTPLQKNSADYYHATVDYEIILIQVQAIPRHCCCEVRFGDLLEPTSTRPISFTLGLGENIIKLLLVDITYPEPKVIRTIRLSLNRTIRGRVDDMTDKDKLHTCSVKQDCSLPFIPSYKCGLQHVHTSWNYFNQLQKPGCRSGDIDGGWVVPCTDCTSVNSCYWKHARWEPVQCKYRQLSHKEASHCLKNKKLLFIGDSTNRGILHFIVERINGSLRSVDKTHNLKHYPNLNRGRTNMAFGYYPHFWLPAKHRPKFHKVLYQLIKRSLPLENNSNTVLVVGGVHWLARKHIDIIMAALKRTGLSDITKVVKGLGAGFHQNIPGVRFVNKEKQYSLLQREQDVFKYAKQYDFKVVGTFNMTMARYKDFTQGKCACHFHKMSKHKAANEERYSVEGDINAAYSQILLNNICDLT